MQYDFTTLTDRSALGSYKWDIMKERDPGVPAGVVPLSVADMEFVTPPEIVRGLKRCLDGEILGYPCRTEGYFSAVTEWMKTRRGFEADPAWLVSSPGIVTALHLIVRALVRPGDGVIIQSPVYYPFYAAVESNGCQVVRCPLVEGPTRYEMDFDALERAASRPDVTLMLLCSPHNPVGRVWTREELLRVAEICIRNKVTVVSDEIHHDIILPGHTHTVFASLHQAAADNCIVCTAPSKTFNIAGLQVSNLFIPNAALRERVEEEFTRVAIFDVNLLGYRACEIAYRECGPWLDALLAQIVENARLTERFLAERLPMIHPFPLEGTYLHWWDCRALGLGHEALDELFVQKARLFDDDGFLFGPEGDGFVRINLACPAAVLQAMLERLAAALAD